MTDATRPVAAVEAPTGSRRSLSSAGFGPARIVHDALLAVGPRRGRLVLLGVLSLVSGLLETTLLLMVGRLALGLTEAEGASEPLDISAGPFSAALTLGEGLVVAAVLLALLVAVAFPLGRVASELCGRTIERNQSRLIDAYLAASWAHRSTHPEGHLHEMVAQHSRRTEAVVQQLATVVLAGFGLATVFLGAVVVAPLLALGAIVVVGLLSLVLRPLSSQLKKLALRNATMTSELASEVAQTARLSLEVSAFDVAPEVSTVLGKDIKRSADVLRQMRFVMRVVPLLYVYGALAAILAVLALVIVGDVGDLATMGPVVLLFVRAVGYAKQVQTASQQSRELAPYVEALEAEIAALEAAPDPSGHEDVPRSWDLRFEGVGFEYVPGQPVLTDVSFELHPGEVLGVVGPSGGGKTSLSQLLLRMRQPTTGRIVVGATDLAEIRAGAWASFVALVPQDNKLVRATVADNIRFYRGRFTDADVEEAARAAHLHDEIAVLPLGYETMVGPGERSLSGGQCQRLGIARALLGRPCLLVLDEPTSALDARSEQLIGQTLEELAGRTTLVLIAHRPATLEICDHLLRVEGGGAVAVGAPSTVGGPPDAATPRPPSWPSS